MAGSDLKISQLTGVTSAISADYFPMVDSTAGETRRITKGDLFGDPGAIGGATAASGITVQTIKLTTSPADGYFLTSDATGTGTWQTLPTRLMAVFM